MDLERALDMANRTLVLPGRSDPGLADIVSGLSGDEARAVRELDGGQQLRVIDALLSLAVATAPKIDNAELYDVYSRWAQQRYLGAFETRGTADDELGLSPVGAAVSGSQRRVFSEELGIGFATWLAQYWRFPGTTGTRATRQLVDADLAWAHGVGDVDIVPIGSRRPDYVIVQQNVDGSSSVAFLECKGTSSPSNALRQLAKASKQLASGYVGRIRPSGLAISTVLNRNETKYLAIQRQWDDDLEALNKDGPNDIPETGIDPDRPRQVFDHYVSSAWQDEPQLPETGAPTVRLGEFGNPQEALIAGAAADDATAIGIATGAAVVASWSALADLAGNEEAFARWAPQPDRLYSTRRPRARTEFVTADSDVIRGVSNTIAVPGGRLEVVIGVLNFVDDALRDGSSATILDAQRRAEDLHADQNTSGSTTGEVTAFGSDGSALVIRAAE